MRLLVSLCVVFSVTLHYGRLVIALWSGCVAPSFPHPAAHLSACRCFASRRRGITKGSNINVFKSDRWCSGGLTAPPLSSRGSRTRVSYGGRVWVVVTDDHGPRSLIAAEVNRSGAPSEVIIDKG